MVRRKRGGTKKAKPKLRCVTARVENFAFHLRWKGIASGSLSVRDATHDDICDVDAQDAHQVYKFNVTAKQSTIHSVLCHNNSTGNGRIFCVVLRF